MPRALFLLALAVFVMGTSEFMLAGLLPAIASDIGVPLGTTGLLTSAFAVGMVIGAPAMAAWARRWPARSTLLLCVVVFAVCHVVSALTTAFPVLLVSRVVAALANAGFLAVALRTVTDLVPPHRTGRALSVLLSGTTLATVVGVPAGALLGAALGWRATFWAVALLCVPAALGVLRGIPRASGTVQTGRVRFGRFRTGTDRTSTRTRTRTSTSTSTSTSTVRGPRLSTELRQLRSPPLRNTMLLGALVNGATFSAFTFLAPVVTDVTGLPDTWVSPVLMAFGIGAYAGVTLAGRLSDRHPGLVVFIGGPLLALGWVALSLWAASPVALVLGAVVQGLLAFGVGTTIITRVLRAAHGAPTMGGAYATVALNLGAAAGPALGAIGLAAGLGTLAPLWIAAALTGLALLIAIPARRTLTGTAEPHTRKDGPRPLPNEPQAPGDTPEP